MRIPKSVRDLYDSHIEDLEALKSDVDQLLRPAAAQRRWHYESRVKELESFALKVETGRVPNPYEMEDWFAATIVVTNQSAMKNAMLLVEGELGCRISYQRPESLWLTTKPSDSFRFDELRLYVRYPETLGARPKQYHARVFELQIKTFLGHAWGIATHESIYKSGDVCWARERIGFQTRASLEQIEGLLAGIDAVTGAVPLPSTERHDRQNEVLKILDKHFEAERLPADRRRLAENTLGVLELGAVDPGGLDEALNSAVGIAKLVTLSPHQVVVAALSQHVEGYVDRVRTSRGRGRILLTPELLDLVPELTELPDSRVVRFLENTASGSAKPESFEDSPGNPKGE